MSCFSPYQTNVLSSVFTSKKSSCTVADRSFSVGTIGEILQALVSVSGGRGVAGRLSNRLLPVLVAGVKDSDPEVRNNSVFGLGCLAQAAGPIVVSYPSYLSVCFSISSVVLLMHNLKENHINVFLSKVCSSDYPMMLSVFSNLLAKESDLRVIDNLCAALCRMILSNMGAVPLEQVHYYNLRLSC